MLSTVKKVFSRLLPGALLLVATTIALHPAGLRNAVAPIIPAFPITVLAGGILLGWRFDRSRLVLALAVLLLTERSLLAWAPVSSAGGETGRAIFGALTLLVPLDLAALAWLPERGLLARPGRLALGLLAAEIVLLALLCQPLFLPLTGWLDTSRGVGGLAALPQPAMRTDKEAAVRGSGRPLEEGLRIEAECFNRLIDGPEMAEGLRRFNERDHPDRVAGGPGSTPGLSRPRTG